MTQFEQDQRDEAAIRELAQDLADIASRLDATQVAIRSELNNQRFATVTLNEVQMSYEDAVRSIDNMISRLCAHAAGTR